MYIHPDNAASLVHDRHRDLRADIGPHRLARQLRDLARTARRTRTTPHRLRRARHPVLRLRALSRGPARPAAEARNA
jgi:hypothetical protein